MTIDRTSLPRAIVFGVVSISLYVLMFVYSDDLVDMARRTREGEKILFLVPIVIAFVFSYVHGAFTGHFWDTLGLKPAKKAGQKKTKHHGHHDAGAQPPQQH